MECLSLVCKVFSLFDWIKHILKVWSYHQTFRCKHYRESFLLFSGTFIVHDKLKANKNEKIKAIVQSRTVIEIFYQFFMVFRYVWFCFAIIYISFESTVSENSMPYGTERDKNKSSFNVVFVLHFRAFIAGKIAQQGRKRRVEGRDAPGKFKGFIWSIWEWE